MASKGRFDKAVRIENRKAYYDYHILDTWQAGVALMGTEIKSIRETKVNMQDAYCDLRGGELFLVNLHIAPYEQGTHYNHEPRRERKLLLTKRELKKVEKGLQENGTTAVPTKIYINDRGFCKVEVGLAKGKKAFDKRDSIKERDVMRDLERY